MPARDGEDSALHEAVGAALTQRGARYTGDRRSLVSALRRHGQPMTIAQIVAAASSLPQSSVYRNMGILEEVGVAHRVTGTDDFARYELAEEFVGHHHHLVCSRCGRLTDVTLPPETEQTLERVLRRVARDQGFTLASHRLDLVGDCILCEADGGRPAR